MKADLIPELLSKRGSKQTAPIWLSVFLAELDSEANAKMFCALRSLPGPHASRGIEKAGYIPYVLVALLVSVVGAVVTRFLALSLLIAAVNLHLQYARFPGVGGKWIVIALAFAMALEHPKICPAYCGACFRHSFRRHHSHAVACCWNTLRT